MTSSRIFLVGLSGAGKSTVGRLVAARLGWEFADSDEEIEKAAGRPVPEIFRSEGEAGFRMREQGVLAKLAKADRTVVSTGGGAPTTSGGRHAIAAGYSVWLRITPARAAARLRAQPATEERPMLSGNPEARLTQLLRERGGLYADADFAIDVDDLTPPQVAGEIVRHWETRAAGLPDAPPLPAEVAAMVRTGSAEYPVIVANGALDELGRICRDRRLSGRAFLLTDEAIAPLYRDQAAAALEAGDYSVATLAIPAGEEHKHLGTVARVYDWLIEHRVERSDFVVCLGGGVLTDLGGFAAATTLRGIDFVQVPTSLLGMVDAAIGGKTGVDHPRGKNLIGAFAQPRAVVIDPSLLETLSDRHRRNGWAEVIKHGLILDPKLTDDLEAGAADPLSMLSPDLIARSVAIKATIVSEDEREADLRTLLNYGHTVGHAIEAVTGYAEYLHGEAVAIGMRAAGTISMELGLLSKSDLERQQRIIRAYGLPESAPGLDLDEILDATRSDKKSRAGDIRWVLLNGIGQAVVRPNVDPVLVRAAVQLVVR